MRLLLRAEFLPPAGTNLMMSDASIFFSHVRKSDAAVVALSRVYAILGTGEEL